MTRASTHVGFTAACLACWLMTFAAGTDVWHDAGRFDVLEMGATAFDVRALAIGYYGLFFLLLAHFAMSAIAFARARQAPPAA
jgi:hypothetical protein